MSRLEAQEPPGRPVGALRVILGLTLVLAVLLAVLLAGMYAVLAP